MIISINMLLITLIISAYSEYICYHDIHLESKKIFIFGTADNFHINFKRSLFVNVYRLLGIRFQTKKKLNFFLCETHMSYFNFFNTSQKLSC